MLQIITYNEQTVRNPEPVQVKSLIIEAIAQIDSSVRPNVRFDIDNIPNRIIFGHSEYLKHSLTQAIQLIASGPVSCRAEIQGDILLIIMIEASGIYFPPEKLALGAELQSQAAERLPLTDSHVKINRDSLWLATIDKAFRLHGGGMIFDNTPDGCFIKFSLMVAGGEIDNKALL